MPCVYACVKNIRKVSRTVWMHFERGMVPVDIRQKFTLHSRKKNDPNSRSLSPFFPLGMVVVVEDDENSFVVLSKTQPYVANEFSAENVLFSDLPLFYKRLGSIGLIRGEAKMSVRGCIYVTDWRNVLLYQINLIPSFPAFPNGNSATGAISSFSIEMH